MVLKRAFIGESQNPNNPRTVKVSTENTPFKTVLWLLARVLMGSFSPQPDPCFSLSIHFYLRSRKSLTPHFVVPV